jgi:peptidoglycan/xylan/chitin deacetylase (PgdA/CDA1 family)
MDMETFRWQLGVLKSKFRLMTFSDFLAAREKTGEWPDYTGVLTVDDGYRDFFECAFPHVKEMATPLTFFVTGRFVDGGIWLWPDRIDYILQNTRKTWFVVNFEGERAELDISDKPKREQAWRILADRCIAMDNVAKEEFLKALASNLEVEVPEKPTNGYDPINWEELREVAASGVEVGSHTMSHPILSKISESELLEEVVFSKKYLESKLGLPVVSFCYPNSGPKDITPYVVEVTRGAGYRGAVHGGGVPGEDLFRVPRIAVCEDRSEFLWKLCGMEVLVNRLRRVLGRSSV